MIPPNILAGVFKLLPLLYEMGQSAFTIIQSNPTAEAEAILEEAKMPKEGDNEEVVMDSGLPILLENLKIRLQTDFESEEQLLSLSTEQLFKSLFLNLSRVLDECDGGWGKEASDLCRTTAALFNKNSEGTSSTANNNKLVSADLERVCLLVYGIILSLHKQTDVQLNK
jgi:hypothetical protein